jgi:hypothetical protein
MQKKETVKTTFNFPREIWEAAKIQAIKERVDLKDIVVKALEAYLKKGGQK